ncbi:MAG: protein-L-isoaspartate(D-aspartate) O-methyltransferase [Solirubrobacteraceae bacterium]
MSGADALIDALRPAIRDERVLEAIAAVPRELFVPDRLRDRAYHNVALPIGCGQTISQPLVVARMLMLLELRPSDRVLDVGTGSGYHAALLARLASRIYTVDRHPQLVAHAREAIAALGLDNIEFFVGDGHHGLTEHAPFDAVNVAAAGESVPAELERQLADRGRLVTPIGTSEQHLVFVRRRGARLERRQLDAVRFVPLVRDREA